MRSSVAFALSLAASVYGHAFVNSVDGDNGVSALGLGVTFNGQVPRGGTEEQPFQLDTPVLKNMVDYPCGATLLNGAVNITDAMAVVRDAYGGVPTVPSNGSLTMGIYQVNADGGGPFTAEINEDATAESWTSIEVTSQPPGVNGIIHGAPANSTIAVTIPSNVTCTGGTDGATCIIRLNNGGPGTGSLANGAGPFGGCVAVSQASSSSDRRRDVVPRTSTPSKRDEALLWLEGKRGEIRRRALEARQKLTAQLINELETATDTATDIPIDNMAGHSDEALLGGNSTAAASDAVLSEEDAVNLKKAVDLAIEQALTLMASDEVDAGEFGQDASITDEKNAESVEELAEGKITSINKGDAGVGYFSTAIVNSLLGGISTATDDLTATATTTADSNDAAVASSAAATTTTHHHHHHDNDDSKKDRRGLAFEKRGYVVEARQDSASAAAATTSASHHHHHHHHLHHHTASASATAAARRDEEMMLKRRPLFADYAQ